MPWSINRGGGCPPARPWAVIKDSDGSREGCHPTREAAERQRRALYASENASYEDIGVEELNRAIRKATLAAFRGEDELTSVYAALLRRAGGQAAARFAREAKLAFNEPYVGEGFVEINDANAEKAQHEAALSFWEVMVLVTPLAFAANEFLTAMSDKARMAMEALIAEELHQLVQDSIRDGLSISQTAEKIAGHFGNMADYTARMLAQTQITAITNEGGLRAAEELERRRKKQIYKTWLTQADNRVRIAHANAGGQTVPLNQPFNVGGYSLMYPGEPAAPLSLIANCRCYLTYTETLVASVATPTLGGVMPGHSEPIGEAFITVKPVIDWSEFTLVPTGSTSASTSWTDTGTATPDAAGMTITLDDPAPEVETEATLAWRGVLTIEGASTGDGRYFAPEAWSWRDLPLTLLAQTRTADGHDGAEVAGRIDNVWKIPAAEAGIEGLPEGAVAVMGEGVFDSGAFGQEIARMVGDQTLRGVSVDFGVSEAGLWDSEAGTLVDPNEVDVAEMMFGNRYERAALKAEIGAATVVAHPAFANANVALVAAGYDLPSQLWLHEADPVLTAAGAGLAPLKPPREWFDDPVFEVPTPLTVTDEGHIFGHIALWGSCHTGLPGCEQPPHSASNYRFFHLKVVETADGAMLPCGTVTLDTGHAPVSLNFERAIKHYDNTGTQAAQIRAGEDSHGIWITGAVHPDLDSAKIRTLRGATPSGDWRSTNGYYRELMGVLAVNLPGFVVPRPEAHVVVDRFGAAETIALVAAGIPDWYEPTEFTTKELRQIRALADSVDFPEEKLVNPPPPSE